MINGCFETISWEDGIAAVTESGVIHILDLAGNETGVVLWPNEAVALAHWIIQMVTHPRCQMDRGAGVLCCASTAPNICMQAEEEDDEEEDDEAEGGEWFVQESDGLDGANEAGVLLPWPGRESEDD